MTKIYRDTFVVRGTIVILFLYLIPTSVGLNGDLERYALSGKKLLCDTSGFNTIK